MMLRESDICDVCCKKFKLGQSLAIIPLGDGTEDSERIDVWVHEKCAGPYREKETKKEAAIKRLQEEITSLEYLASAVRGRAPHTINCRALRRQRRLKRKLLELRQGVGWTSNQWEALKKKYHYRCVCCRKKSLRLEPDHIDPIDNGGAHHISNIQPLCKPCNMKKGARYRDYRPKDVAQWEREIRGQCSHGILTTKPCNRLAIEGKLLCTVHYRGRERETHQR